MLDLEGNIRMEESKFGQAPAAYNSCLNYGHQESTSFDNTNMNNISSIQGSFMNLGRPSDMNEDRIISKETQEARLKAQKIGTIKHMLSDNNQCTDISQIEKNQSISAVLEASTSELDNIREVIVNPKKNILSQKTHFNQNKKHNHSEHDSTMLGKNDRSCLGHQMNEKLNKIMKEDHGNSSAEQYDMLVKEPS